MADSKRSFQSKENILKEFVKAWDPKTGKQYPHLVPAHYIGHPVLGEHYTDKDPAEKPAAVKKASK